MSEEMKKKAIEIAKQALEKYVIVTHCNLSYIAKKHRFKFRYQRESDATFINILLILLKKHSFRYQRECDVAEFITKAFNKEYKSEKWQCIVGRKFGMAL